MAQTTTRPAAPPTDQSAKERIRNAALALFAARGVDAAPMRTIAAEAGVTVGLIVHHYGTKEALRDAVEVAIVGAFEQAIASVPLSSLPPEKLAAGRDDAVAQMLATNPIIVDYLRRALLDGSAESGDVVGRLSRLSAQQVRELRAAGVASTKNTVGEQVVSIMVGQLGRLFLQPLVDRIAGEFEGDIDPTRTPRLVVGIQG